MCRIIDVWHFLIWTFKFEWQDSPEKWEIGNWINIYLKIKFKLQTFLSCEGQLNNEKCYKEHWQEECEEHMSFYIVKEFC
jgi:hypothetical protein